MFWKKADWCEFPNSDIPRQIKVMRTIPANFTVDSVGSWQILLPMQNLKDLTNLIKDPKPFWNVCNTNDVQGLRRFQNLGFEKCLLKYLHQILKGVFSKSSGKMIVAPFLCFLRLWLQILAPALSFRARQIYGVRFYLTYH